MRYVIVRSADGALVTGRTGARYGDDLADATVFRDHAAADAARCAGEHVVAIDHLVLHGRQYRSPAPTGTGQPGAGAT